MLNDEGLYYPNPSDNWVPLPESLFIYEFEMPQNVCGLLIGRFGAYISGIKSKTGASIFIRERTGHSEFQLCTIEGTKSQIDAALALIRAKFPIKNYPQVTLVQVNTPAESIPMFPDSVQLQLPPEGSGGVVISAVIAPNHFFIQQIWHPTYSSLPHLMACMRQCYDNQDTPVPKPIVQNIICAASLMDEWYRVKVVAVHYSMAAFLVDICLVDYGGYRRVPVSCLRQIRVDFMCIPFQSLECFLANVAPANSEEGWSVEAYNQFENLITEKIFQAQAVGFSPEGPPIIYLHETSSQSPISWQLVDSGVAQWA